MNTERLFRLTSDLVASPSVLGNEGVAVERCLAEMRELGYDHVERDEVGNAIGVIEGTRPGPTLLFDGHLDTVDVHPRDRWSFDPFGGEIRGDQILGRGGSDMKGAVAAMIIAGGELDRSTLSGRLVVSASVEEESVEGLALAEVMERFPPDLVVIGEASGLDLVRAGRGRGEAVIETHGVPSHASSPSQGVNAVHSMRRLIEEVEKTEMGRDDFVGEGVLCLTDIVSVPYPAHSVVPSGCRATYERRTLPGESEASFLGAFEEAIERAGVDGSVELAKVDRTTYTGFELEGRKWFPPWQLATDHEFVSRSHAALELALSGRPGQPAVRHASYQFCTNGAHSAGVAGVPTLGFGPSSEDRVHVIDETVDLEQLEWAARGYEALARAMLT